MKFLAIFSILCSSLLGQQSGYIVQVSQSQRIVGATPVAAYRVVSFTVGGAATVIPHVGTANALGLSTSAGSPGASIGIVGYGEGACEFDSTPTVGNVAGFNADKCTDTGLTTVSAVSTGLGVFGRVLAARPDLCALCYTVVVLAPAHNGGKIQMSNLPSGLITLVTSGACATGWSEVAALNGKTVIGTLAANGDVGTTGGSDTITPAGTNSAPTFTGNSVTSSAVSAGTPAGTSSAPAFTGTPGTVPAQTFTGSSATTSSTSGGTPSGTNASGAFTDGAVSWPAGVPTFTGTASTTVVNHTHNLVSTSFTPQLQGGTTASTTGTHIMTSTATGGALRNAGEVTVAATPATGNPNAGGAANYTPAGTITWPAGVPTIAAGVFTQPTFTGNALSGHTHTLTATGTNGAAAFTPAGTIGAPVFTGNALGTHTHTATATGSVSAPAFTGNSADNRSAFIKVIFCSKD